MSNLSNLADVSFVDYDEATIKAAIINKYQEISGRVLAAGDPIRLFLESIAAVIVQQDAVINYTGKMNLLQYSAGDYLDSIGVLVGCTRLSAAAAQTTVQIDLSAAQAFAVTIPKGTRITAGDGVFFASDSIVIIPAGSTTATATFSCTVTGTTGNGYVEGQLSTIVDPIAYVATMVNTTTTADGADVESDDSYRERIAEAPESFSTAGPDGAYEYWAKTASALISDVAVSSPTPGAVKIVPLLDGGAIPGTELLNDVLAAVNDKTIRPLTDNVSAVAPDPVNYNVSVVYYISSDDSASSETIQSAVADAVTAYVSWQKAKLGRDLNPDELNKRIIQAGAKRCVFTSPVYTVLTRDQVAKEGTVSVTLGGIEDD